MKIEISHDATFILIKSTISRLKENFSLLFQNNDYGYWVTVVISQFTIYTVKSKTVKRFYKFLSPYVKQFLGI